MRSSNGMSMSPPAMEEQAVRPHDGGSDSEDWALLQQRQQQQAQDQSIIQNLYHQSQIHSQSQNQSRGSPPLDFPKDPLERPSATNLRSAFRGPARAVTPDLVDGRGAGTSAIALDANMTHISRGLGSQQGSPRSVPGGVARRQGIVFNDKFGEPSDNSETSPPPQQQRHQTSTPIRPRTRTLDASMLGQRGAAPGSEHRHRVGSVSSSGSQPVLMDDQRSPVPVTETMGHPSIVPGRLPEASTPSSVKDKKSFNKKIVKRPSSRPTSPVMSQCPSVDALPFPLATEDANRIISLMKTLGGRMRGDIEYQVETGGVWHKGFAYIDEDKATLMFDACHAVFHVPLVNDLRGCRVQRVEYPELSKIGIELVISQPNQPALEFLLCPLAVDDLDLWLAALLCWQQLRPVGVKMTNGKPASPIAPVRPELKRHGISNDGSKATSIIKVGKIMVWDKGLAMSARSIVHRSSTRDPQNPTMSWRRLSCILQDNGEFRLLMENDVSVLAIIELSQLSRCAIQALDRTVLDEEFCLAIFPIYASTSSRLSIFRPIYLALESRINFEVWFVLLRAFAVPDIFKLDNPQADEIKDVADLEQEQGGEMFRMEKIIGVRVTEAKIKAKPSGLEPPMPERGARTEQDPLVGNYMAEVILDGEVRARTTTKMATKNPFWREDCEFVDLHPMVQELSVVVKRVEGNLGGAASASQSRMMGPQDIVCGTVTISLYQLEGGQAREEWLPILDDRQQNIGSLLMKVTHEEHVALLAKEYEPISEILHRFPAGLTNLISASLPGQLRCLSEIFLNIFQASGSAGDWLMALVEEEIDGIGSQTSMKKYRFSSRLKSNESVDTGTDRELMVRDMSKSLAGEANLLFRGNTLLTQSLEFHMRRVGKEYLEEVLRDKIHDINELNPDCEVDPSKLPHSGSSDIDHHWTRLINLTTEVWECIVDSANRLPSELRYIFKYIRAVAEDRYGDFLRPVAYTAVSGFLFLRFICPAILSPKLFGLLRDHPRPKAQRTLTLIAKALQKLSNLSTFGKREEWMEPMNRYLTTQRNVYRDFIDQVCGIPTERGTKSLPASYSTPVTILGRLGPTAREGFPSLPYLIDHPRSYASLVKLWVEARPMEKKGQVDGELLIFNDLCFGLQKRADACLAKVVELRASGGDSNAADQLAESLEQATLIGSLGIPSFSGPPSITNDIEPPPGSSGSDGAAEDSASRSKEGRRGRDGIYDGRKSSRLRHVSGAGGTLKSKNGKVGRNILSGIMRIGGRAESPDSKGHR